MGPDPQSKGDALMQKKKHLKTIASFAAGAALVMGSQAHAYTAPGVTEGFESDADGFTPDDPSFVDTTFGTGGTNGYPGVRPGDLTPGADDWTDIRGGTFGTGAGLIEEVPSGFNGVTSYAGSNHGIIYWEYPNVNGYYGGPLSRAGRNNTGGGVSGGMLAARVAIYADSNQKFTNDGIYNGQWDSSVNALGGGYMTEGRWEFEPLYSVDGGGNYNGVAKGYRFHVAGATGPGIYDTANVDQWYILEMVFDSTMDASKVWIHYNVIDGVSNNLLASFTAPDYANGAYGTTIGGPRTAGWFFNGNYSNNEAMTNPTGIAIDNLVSGVTPLFIPEPASAALFAAGSALMLRRKNKKA